MRPESQSHNSWHIKADDFVDSADLDRWSDQSVDGLLGDELPHDERVERLSESASCTDAVGRANLDTVDGRVV